MIAGVIGPGALGTLFGAALAKSCDVRVLARDKRTARAIANRGGLIVGDAEPARVTVSHDADIFDDAAIVLVAVKSFETTSALAPLRGRLIEHTPLVSLQNGIDAVERIEFALGHRCCVALAPTTEAAERIESGHARHNAAGTTYAGWAEGHEGGSELDAFVAAVRAGGLKIERVHPVEPHAWAKLVANCAINPLTALAGIRNGELLERPHERERAGRIAHEVAELARRLGIALPFDDATAHVEAVALATAANRSSMLADLEAGRPTEIDAIAGSVVRRAAAAQFHVPETRRAFDEVRAREKA